MRSVSSRFPKNRSEGKRFCGKRFCGKRWMAAALAVMTCAGVWGCTSPAAQSEVLQKTAPKPDHITILADDTLIQEGKGAEEFDRFLEETLQITFDWIRPQSGDYDRVLGDTLEQAAQLQNQEASMQSDQSAALPQVVLLPYDKYVEYAAQGVFWDMTQAWEQSDTKRSTRLYSFAENVLQNVQVPGKDGKRAMYGFTPARGSGCLTYVKKSWMEEAGVTEVPTTWEAYYDMLLKMHQVKGTSVVSAPGFMDEKAPYTSFLKEFYQDAQFDFYQKADGSWADGFGEPAMKAALQRIAKAVTDGVLDKQSVADTLADSTDKFLANQTGVLTYWGGSGQEILEQRLQNKRTGLENGRTGVAAEELVTIDMLQIAGQESYIKQSPSVWCILKTAENPEGIFAYLMDTMLDGGVLQQAWTYGVQQEGLNAASAQKNYITDSLQLAGYQHAYNDPKDYVMTDAMVQYSSQIWEFRKQTLAKVSGGELSVEQGGRYYHDNTDKMVRAVVESLNHPVS